ncbi:hypothetical protein DESUT3_37720 [Desulfuromonas versatilis]|uniref:Undecaprenyl/decaprenyl-phosphate alpha-N-acetylglucosaminyl 1-phosphate transferase n=1 Tax=Desulfuromonas versatilis TaxID=2802975 RepID=A0ABM8I1I6_9BACT|nr:MraY family glycosyltransferase [Desulfuromonas versatilis]BCR06703.1 hypothetical protein DESUT3_37720 [Desulfuromonas versatilis]
MQYFFMFMSALFSALLLVPTVRRLAVAWGKLDTPDARKVHAVPIPRLGGVGIFLAFLFAVLVHQQTGPQVWAVLCGGVVIFLTGVLDDLYGLGPKTKFLGQILACSLTIGLGDLVLADLGNLLGLGSLVLPGWLAVPFTVFAVVGVTNAINLIDGLDGLASGVSLIALAAFSLLAWLGQATVPLALCLALMGGLLGFLKYNSYPARIFMGDGGSLTVGFLLGFLAIMLTQGEQAVVSPVVPVVILGLPIIDTLWVMSRRVLQGQGPFSPDRTHVHHKLLDLGFHHRGTVILIYGASLGWALVAVGLRQAPAYLLLWGYLLTTLAGYLALRQAIRSPRLVPFLNREDSEASLRETPLFRRLQSLADRGVPLLGGGLLVFLLLCLSSVGAEGARVPWPALLLVLAGGLLSLLLSRRLSNHFVLVFQYAAALLLIHAAEPLAATRLLGELTIGQAETAVLVLVGTLVALRIVFRQPGELFLSTPLEFLILAMSLSVVGLAASLGLGHALQPVIAKAMVVFLGVKVVAVRGRLPGGLAFAGGNLALVVIAGRWLF